MLKNGTVRTLGLASRVCGQDALARTRRSLGGTVAARHHPEPGVVFEIADSGDHRGVERLSNVGADAVVAVCGPPSFGCEITYVAAGQELSPSYRQSTRSLFAVPLNSGSCMTSDPNVAGGGPKIRL